MRRRHGIRADRDGLGVKSQRAVRSPYRSLGKADVLLRDVCIGTGAQSLDQLLTFVAGERTAEDGLEALIGISGLDDQAVEIREHVIQCGVLTAPPGRHGRKSQRLAQQALRDLRQEANQRGRLQHTRAQRVGQQHAPRPDRAEQPGNA